MAAHRGDGARWVALSVIVPAYNAEATIERAVGSALAWEGDDLELIVVDDGSTDATGRLLDALAAADDRLRVVHQANSGRSAARNTGVVAARGEWFMFLDADDFLLVDAFPALREAMGTDEELVMFATARSDHERVVWESDAGGVHAAVISDAHLAVCDLRGHIVNAATDSPATSERLGFYTEKSACSHLYRRRLMQAVVDRLGGVGPFMPDLRFAEDMLMNLSYLAVMRHESLLASGQALYFYDLEQSGTWVLTRPEDVLDMFVFRDAVDRMIGCGLATSGERNGLMTYRMADHVRRMGALRLAQLPVACRSWRRVVDDDDLCSCLTKIDFSGMRYSLHFGVPRWLLVRGFVVLALAYAWVFGRVWGAAKCFLRLAHGSAATSQASSGLGEEGIIG